MALSHADVAKRFVELRHGSGSRMTAIPAEATTSESTTGYKPEFITLATCVSYSTPIAWLVLNTFTGDRELWVTPVHYSASTRRHKDWATSAYRAWCRDQCVEGRVYQTNGALAPTNGRAEPYALQTTTPAVQRDLHGACLPRIRDATRTGALASALHRVNAAIHTFTDARDPARVAATGARHMQAAVDLRAQLQYWLQMPVDEARASVAAYLTLNEIPARADVR